MDYGQDKIVSVDLASVMKNSYINYAMSVIVSRALPDVRDGLKPVHRRILYAMQEAGMGSNKPYKKSARIVGEVLGKYHPHGDISVYDAIVRMAQDFSIRYLLADGHGNFGSVDGDPAAAMRYTEVRMSKISELMLKDIEKNTVDFTPNYDESLNEPTVLPARFPQLLVNGSEGIAVGMATKIPPHNLKEAIDGALMVLDNPQATVDDLMTVIKGPDFPTGAQIMGFGGISDMYHTGRGSIKMRAVSHIEEIKNGKKQIIVTELPYQVNKARLIESIAQLHRDKKVEGITALRDESDRDGMRIVIELKRDATPKVVLNQLYKHTQLQETFGAILLALDGGTPRTMNLAEILTAYIEHQKVVTRRRTEYELDKAKARAHILEGLTIALDHLDAVITTIRQSKDGEVAKAALMNGFGLSDKQAQAILDMRLQRLTGLERDKIREEYQEILKTIDWLNSVLSDEEKLKGIIKEELKTVKEQFGDDRRTQIVAADGEIDLESVIPTEDIVVTLTRGSYIKRLPLTTYKSQKRGGKGITGMKTKDEDIVETLLLTTTHHTILFFTSRGRVYKLKGYDINEATRQAKGQHLSNLLQLSGGEKITAVIPIRKFTGDCKSDKEREQVTQFLEENFLLMATKRGIVKKTPLSAFDNIRSGGIIAIKLDGDDGDKGKGDGLEAAAIPNSGGDILTVGDFDDGDFLRSEGEDEADGGMDELISVRLTNGTSDVIIGTRDGQAIVFNEAGVRAMGRQTRGVKGITLVDNDEVIGMDVVEDLANDGREVLAITQLGFGKRTPLVDYRKTARGGKGVKNFKVAEKTGSVIGLKLVKGDEELLLITTGGIVIRTPIGDIRNVSRNTSGVKVITPTPGDMVASFAVSDTKDEDRDEDNGELQVVKAEPSEMEKAATLAREAEAADKALDNLTGPEEE